MTPAKDDRKKVARIAQPRAVLKKSSVKSETQLKPERSFSNETLDFITKQFNKSIHVHETENDQNVTNLVPEGKPSDGNIESYKKWIEEVRKSTLKVTAWSIFNH